MLKRRLLLSFLTMMSFCSSVFAYTGDNAFTGLYLAADVGAIQMLAQNKQDLTVTGTNTLTLSDNHPTSETTAFTGGVAMGFSYLADNCFYIALEGRGDFQSPEIKNKRNSSTTVTPATGVATNITTETERTIKIDDTVSVLLKPGFAIGQDRETIIYGIVGATSGKIKAKSTANVSIAGSSTTNLSFSSQEKNNRTTGVSGGIGVEHAFFTSNATVGAEYVYTDYGSVKFDNGTGTTGPGGAAIVSSNNKVDVQTNVFMVKVAYRFPI